jgi:uncharacterized protein (TIGR02145 family)
MIMGVFLMLLNNCKKENTSTSSNEIIFNPNLTYGTVTDIDGNVYRTITIGTQTWMAENLKTVKYNDGVQIPNVTDNDAWMFLETPAYCWLDNDVSTYKKLYGALYNWYAVKTGKLCPTGWHVPTNAEWTTLTTYAGGDSIAGGKLKETGTTHWMSPNIGATNEFGFTALPSAERTDGGYSMVYDIGRSGFWWSASEFDIWEAYDILINYEDDRVWRHEGNGKEWGFSVRCVKD